MQNLGAWWLSGPENATDKLQFQKGFKEILSTWVVYVNFSLCMSEVMQMKRPKFPSLNSVPGILQSAILFCERYFFHFLHLYS